jgi:3-phosphoshikimate 1-carboxyvinyltransferase
VSASPTPPEPLADPLPIRPRGPLDARVRPPGSRSLTNRALAAAALAAGPSELVGATESDDAAAMREGLGRLGVPVAVAGDTWHVAGGGGQLAGAGAIAVDVRASGTTARFLTALAALTPRGTEVTLDGTARMRERPIRELIDALSALGVDAAALGPGGCPPVRVRGGGLAGGRVRIDASRSSQYVSAVLLAAPCAAADVTLELAEGRLVSRPFVDLTLQVMAAFGADAGWTDGGALTVRAGAPYRARRYAIEPDAQAAVYAFAAAAIAGGRVVVEGIPPDSRQPDLHVLDALEAMGCRIRRDADRIEVRAERGALDGIRWNGNRAPDAVLALAVVALFARGPTEIHDIANLRIKETDRLAALETEIRRLGGRAEAGPDWLRIEPAPLRGAAVSTYEDHRIAMSFALAGLVVPGVSIRDPGCVAKTWPDFFAALGSW